MTAAKVSTNQLLQQLAGLNQQLDDVARDKAQALAELARLRRRRAELAAAAESSQTVSLVPYQPLETSAQAYVGSLPVQYLQDRHGQAGRLLHPPAGRQRELEAALLGDDLQAFNGRGPALQSNVAGLGGVLGPKLDFGARAQTVANTTRFLDEVQKPSFQGLLAKRDLDGDFTRVNFAQLRLAGGPWLVGARRGVAGPVPAPRIMQEEPLLRAEHRMVQINAGGPYQAVLAEDGFDQAHGLQGRAGLGRALAAAGLLDEAAFWGARRAAARADLRAQCLAHRAAVRQRYSETRFAEDLRWVRAHLPAHRYSTEGARLLSDTAGWRDERQAHARLRALLLRGVRNYGRWCIEPGRQAALPVRASERDAYLVRGRRAE